MESMTTTAVRHNNFTRVTAEETALRQCLHAAVETAVKVYMAASKQQDIVGIEIFPTPQ